MPNEENHVFKSELTLSDGFYASIGAKTKESRVDREENFDDLLKRLNGLEHRFDLNAGFAGLEIVQRPAGTFVDFEQVKTVVGQWIADQRGK